ncbi:chymotrypsin-like elastase family member 2A [Teleopsis dalmanni]|uniref:chymotrypsin-like elastase family member 2A n=1 Tax=Teleopsis dalmanni TaxID=139649 RepID=UPI0018CE1B53|nr:chymotrypsin-like elastase family member 2A [Teleopsis dalmanni]
METRRRLLWSKLVFAIFSLFITHFSIIPAFKLDGVAKTPVPFVGSLQRMEDNSWHHYCTVSIIDERFVLSAAHCFLKSKDVTDYTVVVGTNEMDLIDGDRHNVVDLMWHEYYYFGELFGNDIAVLKVEPMFQLNGKTIDKISTNLDEEVPKDIKSYLLAWVQEKHLQFLPFRTQENIECMLDGFIYLTSSEMCALSVGVTGACDGDSGGPLVSTDLSQQLGLLSYGKGTSCKTGRPYVFTRIYKQKDWIISAMYNMTKDEENDIESFVKT